MVHGVMMCQIIAVPSLGMSSQTLMSFLKSFQSLDLVALEHFVAHEVCKWPEVIEVAYYREKKNEVDFVITYGGNRYLPVEVKHRKYDDRAPGLKHFMKKYKLEFGVVITRGRSCHFDEGILYLPLRYFLLTN